MLTKQTHRARFTLLEMVVVLAVMGLVMALVLPRATRTPRRLVIARALSSVRSVLRQAGMRARATGADVQVVVDPEQNTIGLGGSAAPGVVSNTARPEARVGGGAPADRRSGLWEGLTAQQLPDDLEWVDFDAVEPTRIQAFEFFPDGSAAGRTLTFALRGSRFELSVDRLTGRPAIHELGY